MQAAERLTTPVPPPRRSGVRFKERSPGVARLKGSRADAGEFGLSSRGPRWHELGPRRSPLFLLEVQAGELEVSRPPRGLALGETPEPEWGFAAPYLEWAEGAGVDHGLSLAVRVPADWLVPARAVATSTGRRGLDPEVGLAKHEGVEVEAREQVPGQQRAELAADRVGARGSRS